MRSAETGSPIEVYSHNASSLQHRVHIQRGMLACRDTFDCWHAIHRCACPGATPLKSDLAADPSSTHRRGLVTRITLKTKGLPDDRSAGLSNSGIHHKPSASAAAGMALSAEANSATWAEKRVSFKNAKGEQIIGILADTGSEVSPGHL